MIARTHAPRRREGKSGRERGGGWRSGEGASAIPRLSFRRRRHHADGHGPARSSDALFSFTCSADLTVPKGLIAFPGSGITGNLVDKARKLGIPVQRVMLT